jgi:hypothetical protein
VGAIQGAAARPASQSGIEPEAEPLLAREPAEAAEAAVAEAASSSVDYDEDEANMRARMQDVFDAELERAAAADRFSAALENKRRVRKDAESAQKLGQLQPLIAAFP